MLDDKKYTLITGASSGIGYELAKVFASNNHNLILVARNLEKLAIIKDKLANIEVLIYPCDLANSKEIDGLIKLLDERNIEILINNAGVGDFGCFSERSWDIHQNIYDLNILALTKLTHAFMSKNKEGKILNVASTASFQAGPFMASYYASKAYVLSLSESISAEEERIQISVLCPGPTKTNFFDNAGASSSKLLDNMHPMPPTKVASYCYKKFMKGKTLIIPGIINKLIIFGERFLPRKMVIKIMKSIQGKRKNSK